MNDRLARALKFTAADLEQNRQGRISAAQRQPYTTPPVSRIAVYVILGHGALLLGLLGAIAVVANQPVMWLVLGIVAVMGLMPLFLTRSEFLSRPVVQDDVNRGKVAQVCGVVSLTMEGKRYDLRVGTYEFRGVSLKVWGAFKQNIAYCVYYLPRSGVILSAEECPDDQGA
ncbi:hypothetical protein VZO05_11920 [Aggregatilineales bacterium SYSU G02658]